jgi:DNA polymerase elongation subunit (family B)
MNQNYQFQIVDIQSDDLKHKTRKGEESRFTITLYGKTSDKLNIVTHIVGYYPYFYLKIPDDWERSKLMKFLKNELIKTDKRRGYGIKDNMHEAKIKIQNYKEFYGLQLNEDNTVKTSQFAKVVFKTLTHMKQMCSCITDYYHNYYKPEHRDWKPDPRYEDWQNQDEYHGCESHLYESNIHPIIRFIHDTKIKPGGWVQCVADQNEDENHFHTDIEISLKLKVQKYSYTNFGPIDIDTISEYLIASYDIECDSSHGDFPQAKKDFKKLVMDMYQAYEKIVKEYSTFYDSNEDKQKLLEILINLGFYEKYDKFSRTNKYYDINHNFTENGLPTNESIMELIDLIKEQWFTHFTQEKILTKDRDLFLKKIKQIFNETLKNEKEELIQVQGDPVIQIGVVFYRYGVTDSMDRHILVIGPEDNMETDQICDRKYLGDLNINCINCKDEKEMFIQFKHLMKEKDPDFITGYNIFGFDFKYLKERGDILFQCPTKKNGVSYCNQWGHCKFCPSKKFYNMGKLNMYDKYRDHKSKVCKFNKQQLNSAAFGENDLSYISMDGRILFDIQKEVQKSYSLESYKLDNVAAHFMRGKIKECQENILITDNIGNLKDGDFISFSISSNIGESMYENGKKYKIDHIDGKELHMIDTLQFTMDGSTKVEWCLNKDDISPQDIFDKHKVRDETGAYQRAEVAKYCIQDCELCINLLLLLDIIPNNIAMANVSYVPVSYIFLRGQGVKVSSVVSRKSNERGYRIPTLGKRPIMKEYTPKTKLERGYQCFACARALRRNLENKY